MTSIYGTAKSEKANVSEFASCQQGRVDGSDL